MKHFFNKLGFHKMDEMEQNIALRAQRNALIYVAMALMVWSLYESFKVYTQHTAMSLVPGFLLVTTALVLVFSQLFLQRRATKGDDEYEKANPIFKVILAVVMLVGMIVSIGAMLVFMGR